MRLDLRGVAFWRPRFGLPALQSIGIHRSSQWLWDWPRSTAGDEGYPDMRINQQFAIPNDPLMQDNGRTLHHLWLSDYFEHIVHVGRLKEIDLH